MTLTLNRNRKPHNTFRNKLYAITKPVRYLQSINAINLYILYKIVNNFQFPIVIKKKKKHFYDKT